jgi:hypothetical protein
LFLKESAFQIRFLKVRDSPEVILAASLRLGPLHGPPLEQVGRHLLAMLIRGSPIEIPGPFPLPEGHDSAHQLLLEISKKQLRPAAWGKKVKCPMVVSLRVRSKPVPSGSDPHQIAKRLDILRTLDSDAVTLGKMDVVSGLLFHSAQDLFFGGLQVDHNRARGLDGVGAGPEAQLHQPGLQSGIFGQVRLDLEGKGMPLPAKRI